MANEKRDTAERVRYWQGQIEMAEKARWSPTRDKVIEVCRMRLAIWERRAALTVIDGGGQLRRARSA